MHGVVIPLVHSSFIRNPDISSQPTNTRASPGYTASLLSDVRRPSRAAKAPAGTSGLSSSSSSRNAAGASGGSSSASSSTSSSRRTTTELAEKYGLGQAFVTDKLVNPTKRGKRVDFKSLENKKSPSLNCL